MQVQTAHLGHWYVQLAFAVPALVAIGMILRDSVRRRWNERGRGRTEGSEPRARR